jgi:hypothetical protein
MIEKGICNGREALIGYMDDQFVPQDKDSPLATLCKVHFLDGEGPIMILRLRPPPPASE